VNGLTSEQFGRAVLLAQGDFEAFIRADANERALLLEKLTGSDIYARVGRRAFEKARDLQAALDDLYRQIAAQNGLSDEERAAAEAERNDAAAAEQAADAVLSVLKEAQRWEEREAELAKELARAQQAVTDGEVALDGAEPRRTALARARQAARLIPAWIASSEAVRNHAEAGERVAAEEQTLAAAQTAKQDAETREGDARTALTACTTEQAALAPVLRQARELDLRLAEAETQRMQADDEARRRRAEAITAEEERERHTTARDATTRDHAAAQDWLTAHDNIGKAAARRGDIASHLADHARSAATLAVLSEQMPQLKQAEQQALSSWDKAGDALSGAQEAHAAAGKALASAEAVLPPDSHLDALTATRERLLGIETLLRSEAEARQRREDTDRALASTRAMVLDTERDQAKQAAQEAELAARLPLLSDNLGEARHQFDLVAAALDGAAAGLREKLREGDPCPVCGSAEHHLELFTGELEKQLGPLREAAAAQEAELAIATEAHGRAELAAASLANRFDLLRRQQIEQAAALDRAVQALEQASVATNKAAEAEALATARETLPDEVTARLAGNEQERAALQAARDRAATARRDEQTARDALDMARSDHGSARDALALAARAHEEAGRDLASAQQDADRLALVLDRWLAPLADWRSLADAANWLATECSAWDAQRRACEALAAALPGLNQAATRSESAAEHAGQLASDAEQALSRATEVHAALQTKRSALLGGEAADAVEQRLTEAQDDAGRILQGAATALAAAAQAALATEIRLGECRKARAAAAQEESVRQAALANALTAAGLTTEEVAAVHAQGEASLDSEAEALAALQRALDNARALSAERDRVLAAHRASGRPDMLGADLVATLATAEADHATTVRRLQEAELRLRMDDAVRTRTEALRAELERKNAEADIWLRLNDLIGDRTGAIFRRFAQGLTLERLLAHANAHLAELKPRFTLERGAGGEMLIQVIDNDMGGEVRGLHNLSGGERFLVSLALALGLAAMSTTGGVRIESLFIDEGFGALDPASLGNAVALLEQLHATGRRVGVISHVEELKERIPVKIEVTPTGRGTSRIAVVGG
jgi:exonuclease SbcC